MNDFSRKQVLAYRLQVNHLAGGRFPRAALAAGAHSGLQDGSPRSGLLSLAARVDGVGHDDWRGAGLAQVFGPRGAIYIVRQEDVAVFTRGLLPRDTERVATIELVAGRVHKVLNGRPLRQADVVEALPDIGGTRGLRWAATLGTLVPVWDAIDTIVHPRPLPDVDAEDARLELARRFFTYLGPATVADLQWWLDGRRRDATTTVAALDDELAQVTVRGRECLAFAATLPLLESVTRPDSDLTHLLPPDDVYINRLNRTLLIPDVARQKHLFPQAPPPGALVVGGEVFGTWRRRAGAVEVSSWRAVESRHRERAEEIVAGWPLATKGSVTWRDPS